MPSGRINDWSALTEANVEIRKQGTPICSGTVDAVTEDGKILWIHSTAEGRRQFEKSAFFEVWPAEERLGFHYRLAAG